MTPLRRQTGFTLITAIFLLVVIATLVVYMTNIRVAQQTTVLYGVQGARAIMV
ncbi:MAG: agglutinin biogenesis protein MshP, partial [Chloroflexi bacterium]